MAEEREIVFADLVQAAGTRDPHFPDLVVRYLQLSDPPEDRPELLPEEDDTGPGSAPVVPAADRNAFSMARLRTALAPDKMLHLTATEQMAARREAWAQISAAPHHPPRLDLGTMLVEMYRRNEEADRAALMDIFGRAKICWGLWQGYKRVFKMAEQRHDAAMFGLLACRLDTLSGSGEISGATIGYMRRRAWRYLRLLGQAMPEMFPQFGVQVLRHYPPGYRFHGSWIAHRIWNYEEYKGTASGGWSDGPPKEVKRRAFHRAWKVSADPLLRLLEDAQNDKVCDFSIRGLQEDFAAKLQKVDPRWLARLGAKKQPSVHEFVVTLLQAGPDFHQSKLKKLGLHDMVVGLLLSESAAARKYAVEYAQAHAQDLPVDELVRLCLDGQAEVVTFASARLLQRKSSELGLTRLARLIGVSAVSKAIVERIHRDFTVDDLDAELFIDIITGGNKQLQFLNDFYLAAKKKPPAAFHFALLEDPRCTRGTRRVALDALQKREGREFDFAWVKRALLDSDLRQNVIGWFQTDKFGGDQLDVEWLKGLVVRPALRAMALHVLGKTELVAPSRIGLGWLLAIARQADETLSAFAHGYLLEHFGPEDVAAGLGSKDIEVGVDRLWQLAAGAREPEPVRAFAASYLKLHHPLLGPTLPEARSYGIKPRLSRESYSLARLSPLFDDSRQDVRKLAAAIGRHEVLRWNDASLLYRLASSRFRETRGWATELLLQIGESDADPRQVPPVGWIDGAKVFALAESSVKVCRETALTLIRRHYAQIGGAERLAWLMESPEREVRLFAVRLLWEKHRPRAAGEWNPTKGSGIAVAAERFSTGEALRHFLRTVMFGLPPGRMERREMAPGEALPDRALPASDAKHRLIGVVRDLALEDAGFAEIVVPVLEEFSVSEAKGEWQACVAALAQLRSTYAELSVRLPAPAAAETPAAAGPVS